MSEGNGKALTHTEIVKKLRSTEAGDCAQALASLFPGKDVLLLYTNKQTTSMVHTTDMSLTEVLGVLMWALAKVSELSRMAILVGSMPDPRKGSGIVLPGPTPLR